MKKLTSRFSPKELTLIGILIVMLLVLVLYYAVKTPLDNKVAAAEQENYALQDEELVAQNKALIAQQKQSELDSQETKDSGMMPSYNGSKAELTLLNHVLSQAIEYDVQFTEVTRYGDQIRRYFEMSFITADYTSAEQIIQSLSGSEYRLQIQDLVFQKEEGDGETADTMKCSLSAVFFETMVGGTEDAGLPVDQEVLEEMAAEAEAETE